MRLFRRLDYFYGSVSSFFSLVHPPVFFMIISVSVQCGHFGETSYSNWRCSKQLWLRRDEVQSFLKSNSCKGFEVIVKVVKMCKIIENVLTRSCHALQRIEIPNWTTHFGSGFYYHDESGADCQETIVNIDSCYKESTCNFPSWQIPGDQRRYLVGFLRFDLYICLPSCRKGAVHGTVYLNNLCCLAGEPHIILYSKYPSTSSLPSVYPLFLFTFSTSSKKHCTRIIKSC